MEFAFVMYKLKMHLQNVNMLWNDGMKIDFASFSPNILLHSKMKRDTAIMASTSLYQ